MWLEKYLVKFVTRALNIHQYRLVQFSLLFGFRCICRCGIEFKPNKALNFVIWFGITNAICRWLWIHCLSARCSSLSSMKSHVFHDTNPLLSPNMNVRERDRRDRKTKRLNFKQSTFHLAFWSNRELLHLYITLIRSIRRSLSTSSSSSSSLSIIYHAYIAREKYLFTMQFVFPFIGRCVCNMAHSSIHSSLSSF